MSSKQKISDGQAGSESSRLLANGYARWLRDRVREMAFDSFECAESAGELHSARVLLTFADLMASAIEESAKHSETRDA